MIKYYDLINQKSKIKYEIKQEKRQMHKDFVKINKKTFMILDILFVVCILMNLGALVLTNAMVIKASTVEPVFMEVNPISAELHDLVEHPESKQLFNDYLIWCIKWSIVIFWYICVRKTAKTYFDLWLLIFSMVWMFTLMSSDVFNNLGLSIGMWLR